MCTGSIKHPFSLAHKGKEDKVRLWGGYGNIRHLKGGKVNGKYGKASFNPLPAGIS